MGKYEKAAKNIREKQAFQKEQQRLHEKYKEESDQVVIKEKSNMVKFTIRTCSSLIRILAGILLLCLSAIGVLTLLYPQVRNPLFLVLREIYHETFGMFS